MKSLLTLLFLAAFLNSNFAQKNQHDFSMEINEQIWEPFKEAYATNNADLYNSLHAEDVLRVTKHGIQEGEEYKNNNVKHFAKNDDVKRIIDFRFEHRIHSGGTAYEIGYYKLTYLRKDSNPETHYGRFHVVLEKEKDQWLINQDWDTNDINGQNVTSDDFDKLGGSKLVD